MLHNIDYNIQRLLDCVAARGELGQTLVIYTADHGEMLGDFHRYNKGRPERGAVRIPLVIRGPGVERGLCTPALVELQDLAATICDYAGTSAPPTNDALSLRPTLEGTSANHRAYQVSQLSGGSPWQMIADPQHKMVLGADGERLYDLEKDPWENDNISHERPEIAQHLREQLRQEVSLPGA
jgi:arylsulfatase A-like enzyme